MLTQAGFLLRYPEFNADSLLIPACLADASLLVGEAEWGDYFEAGGYALTAHYLTLRKAEVDSGGIGASLEPLVAGKAADGVSVTFATPGSGYSLSDLALSGTTYGLRYLDLRRTVGTGCLAI